MKYSLDWEPLKGLSHVEFRFFGLSYSGKVYFVTITGKLGLVNECHMDSQVCRVLDRVLAACHAARDFGDEFGGLKQTRLQPL